MDLPIKEIRIGNIISKDGERVTITLDNISEVLNNIDDFQPIYIDKDLLLKSGFKLLRKNCYILEDCEDYHLLFTGKIGIFCKVGRGTVSIPFRYLHELQNILFFLEGRDFKPAL